MRVVAVTRAPGQKNDACPNERVILKIGVQPEYINLGGYEIQVFGTDQPYGPFWNRITTVSGWANPLGGIFYVEVPVNLPTTHSGTYLFGAKETTEPIPNIPDYTCSFAYPYGELNTAGASPRSGNAPLTVQFSCSGNPEITSIIWDFGDGTSERGGTSISHTYVRRGVYDVEACPVDRCGNYQSSIRKYVGRITVYDTRCYDPDGNDGDFSCSGTTRIRCNSGTWEVYERNSTHCGYVSPGPGEPEPPVTRDCTNPPGEHGELACDGRNLIQCSDGTWILKEQNSPQCPDSGSPIPPPGLGCSNPAGVLGDTYCRGTTLMRCNGTEWLVQDYNSAQCRPPTSTDSSNTLLLVGVGVAAALGIGYIAMKIPRR